MWLYAATYTLDLCVNTKLDVKLTSADWGKNGPWSKEYLVKSTVPDSAHSVSFILLPTFCLETGVEAN